jgi:hypothetical protein
MKEKYENLIKIVILKQLLFCPAYLWEINKDNFGGLKSELFLILLAIRIT